MRQVFAVLILLFTFATPAAAASVFSLPVATLSVSELPAGLASAKTLKSQINRRISRLDLPVATVPTDRYLHQKLNDLLSGHRHTELMLGRAEAYFPVFEEILCSYDLPEQLKYLAVVESMLRPQSYSSANAAGLWQLMPATARAYGLRVDDYVDERLDLHKSTDAAARLLRALYEEYGDWHLAVAAYNAGSTRVNRAVRYAGGSADYERVRQYLPRETRDYVGAYVAAAYTLNYYENHGLAATEQASETLAAVRVHRWSSLRRLAKLAGVEYRTLKRLNPALVQRAVPTSRNGYALRLPARCQHALQTALWGQPNLIYTDELLQLAEQRALAQVQGFEASDWLVGCRNVIGYDDNVVFSRKAGELSRAWLAGRMLVAML